MASRTSRSSQATLEEATYATLVRSVIENHSIPRPTPGSQARGEELIKSVVNHLRSESAPYRDIKMVTTTIATMISLTGVEQSLNVYSSLKAAELPKSTGTITPPPPALKINTAAMALSELTKNTSCHGRIKNLERSLRLRNWLRTNHSSMDELLLTHAAGAHSLNRDMLWPVLTDAKLEAKIVAQLKDLMGSLGALATLSGITMEQSGFTLCDLAACAPLFGAALQHLLGLEPAYRDIFRLFDEQFVRHLINDTDPDLEIQFAEVPKAWSVKSLEELYSQVYDFDFDAEDQEEGRQE